MSRTHERELSCAQTIRSRGVCEPALEPRGEGEGSQTRGQDFKPDLGNSAVRRYRGASEKVAMVEMRAQLAIERAGLVTLHLQPARRSSIPTKTLNERNGLVTSINRHVPRTLMLVTCLDPIIPYLTRFSESGTRGRMQIEFQPPDESTILALLASA